MSFSAVLRFFTVIPARAAGADDPAAVGRSIALFPVAGLVLGIVLGGLYYLLSMVLPHHITSVLLVAALAGLTGAHHVDGLIDTFDATAAGKTREQRLSIMSDTRVGSFGIVAICLVVLLKYAGILEMTAPSMLIVFPVMSRWAVGGAILLFPSAKEFGAGHAVKQAARSSGMVIATVVTLVVTVALMGAVAGPLVMAVALGLLLLAGHCLSRLFGGLTGDCYGALIEIGEALVILLVIAFEALAPVVPGYHLLSIPLPG